LLTGGQGRKHSKIFHEQIPPMRAIRVAAHVCATDPNVDSATEQGNRDVGATISFVSAPDRVFTSTATDGFHA
jgi:hypothetical protein